MLNTPPSRPLESRRLGSISYREALEIQSDLVRRRRDAEIPDQLLLLEHPHVITQGSGSEPGHILVSPEERRLLGVELWETGRGGDVTYHGPGQLIGYPILDLKPDRKDVHQYLRDLEGVLMEVVESYGVGAERRPGMTGVWTAGGKVAAIGVRISSGWISSHGFALNVSTDLSFFGTIIPCGIQGEAVASLEGLVGHEISMGEVMDRVEDAFARRFERAISREAAKTH
jgi:lipoyl(octanoyl) transferase